MAKFRKAEKRQGEWWADREQDLLAEIARLRGALRAVQMHAEAGTRLAITHLSITPEDMKE